MNGKTHACTPLSLGSGSQHFGLFRVDRPDQSNLANYSGTNWWIAHSLFEFGSQQVRHLLFGHLCDLRRMEIAYIERRAHNDLDPRLGRDLLKHGWITANSYWSHLHNAAATGLLKLPQGRSDQIHVDQLHGFL